MCSISRIQRDVCLRSSYRCSVSSLLQTHLKSFCCSGTFCPHVTSESFTDLLTSSLCRKTFTRQFPGLVRVVKYMTSLLLSFMNYFFMLMGKHPGIIFNKTWIIKLWQTSGDGLQRVRWRKKYVWQDEDLLTLCWLWLMSLTSSRSTCDQRPHAADGLRFPAFILVKMLCLSVFSCVVSLSAPRSLITVFPARHTFINTPLSSAKCVHFISNVRIFNIILLYRSVKF